MDVPISLFVIPSMSIYTDTITLQYNNDLITINKQILKIYFFYITEELFLHIYTQ